ncbi:MAG: hypothetical protein QOJ06_490 [Pseudonocardiales bacterium]|nr:hypothetical protein [Pseudonocardiales bacterium]
MPLHVRGDHAGGAAVVTRRVPRGAVVVHACAPSGTAVGGLGVVGSVRAWGSSTTRPRVAGGRCGAGAAGCSALRAWRWVRCIAAGVTPRAVTMFGMDTPATIRNKTISRSGLGSVASSAGSRAQYLASTRRWLGSREFLIVPRPPVPGFGGRPWDPVGPWPTGVCAGQPRSASHARGQLGDISGVPGRRTTAEERDDPVRRITYPRTARARRLSPSSRGAGVQGVCDG